MKTPTLEQAKALLSEAESMYPGDWVAHNKVAGYCAREIAENCVDMDGKTAYALGLLHDVGRRFGFTDMRHILDGYNFMNEQGFDLSARICLTHSFPNKNIAEYSGKCDLTEDERKYVQKLINDAEYNDYDRLIQLCDAISFPTGVTFVEKRLVDVVMRRGFNDLTIQKWKAFLNLKEYFDKKVGSDIYKLFEEII